MAVALESSNQEKTKKAPIIRGFFLNSIFYFLHFPARQMVIGSLLQVAHATKGEFPLTVLILMLVLV